MFSQNTQSCHIFSYICDYYLFLGSDIYNYQVFCYGTHEVALVKRDELFPYDKNSGFGKVKKRRRGFAEALDEIENNPSIMTIDMLTAHREELADTGKIFNQEWESEDNTTTEIMGKAMTKRLKDMSSTANDILALLKVLIMGIYTIIKKVLCLK